jgi:hypothetical protein
MRLCDLVHTHEVASHSYTEFEHSPFCPFIPDYPWQVHVYLIAVHTLMTADLSDCSSYFEFCIMILSYIYSPKWTPSEGNIVGYVIAMHVLMYLTPIQKSHSTRVLIRYTKAWLQWLFYFVYWNIAMRNYSQAYLVVCRCWVCSIMSKVK